MRLKTLCALVAGVMIAGAAPAQAQKPPPAVPAPSVVPPPAAPENIWNLDLSTGGRVSIQLRPDIAPNHVERIKALTRQGFYNGLIFHRVIEGFMAQGGDPTGTGTGGSQLPDLAAEFNLLPHVRGTVSAARSEAEDSANSQFFILFAPRLSLDRRYSAFGRVISGMTYVDAIARGEPPPTPARILRASLGSDNVPPPAPGEVIATPRPAVVPAIAIADSAPSPANAAPETGEKAKVEPQP
jgi:cyclophilin family peptidyl-prolyl cis-trans isomerase